MDGKVQGSGNATAVQHAREKFRLRNIQLVGLNMQNGKRVEELLSCIFAERVIDTMIQ